LGFRVWGLGFGVWGLGFGVWGLGFAMSAQYRQSERLNQEHSRQQLTRECDTAGSRMEYARRMAVQQVSRHSLPGSYT